MGAEEALIHLGGIGTWQLIHFVLISSMFALPSMWQIFNFVFQGFSYHDYHCRPAPGLTLNQSIPPSNDTQNGFASCERYKYNSSYRPDLTVPCDSGFKVSPDYFNPDRGTVLMEFGLFCDQTYLVDVSQMLFTSGMVFGSWCFSPFSDWFGRKKVFFLGQLLICIFGVAKAFVTTFPGFCVLQFVIGSFVNGHDLSGFVLGNELFPAQMRAYMAPAMYLFVALGMMSLVLFSYFLRHWRHLQLATSVVSMVMLLYWWFCPESVRWLIANDKHDDAKNILDSAAKTNRIPPVPMDVIKYEKTDVTSATKHPTLSKYLSHRKTVVFFLSMAFIMFTNNMFYFGLSLMAQTLPMNLYLSFFLLGALEIPGTIAAIVAMQKFGRRIPLCVFNLVAAVLMALTTVFAAVPEELIGLTRGQKNILVASLALTSKFGVAGAWSTELVYTQEIFPTNLRGLGVGVVGGIGHVGGIVAPLGVLLARDVSFWVPTAIFSSLTFVAAFMSLLLPETLGRPLPTTVEEILAWNLTLSREEKEEFKQRKDDLVEQRRRLRSYRKSSAGRANPAYTSDNEAQSKTRIPSVSYAPSGSKFLPGLSGKEQYIDEEILSDNSSCVPTKL